MLRVIQQLTALLLMWAMFMAPLQASVPSNLYVLAPPSVDDIMRSMGPDAQGLQIQAENIPDIFTLTSGRIDEDAKKFIVQQPYISGRWMGGHAVIEYARDLSYTLISVYDKKGKRQRIYSVTAQPKTKQAAKKLAQAKEAPVPDEAFPVTATADIPEPEDFEATPPKEDKPRPSKSRKSPERGQSIDSELTPVKSTGAGGFEWDDEAGAYVSKKGKRSRSVESVSLDTAKKGVTSNDRKPVSSVVRTPPAPEGRNGGTTKEPVGVPVADVVSSDVPSTEDLLASEPIPEKPMLTVSSAAPSKPKRGTAERAAKPSEMVWDDDAGAYVPAKGPSVAAAAAPALPEKRSAVSAEADRILAAYEEREPRSKKRKRDSQKIADMMESAPVAVAEVSKSLEPSAPEPASPESAGPDTGSADAWVPKATPPRPKNADVEDPALAAAMKVASLPKPVRGGASSASIDDLLKMAAQSKTAVPSEGDAWVPKSQTSAARRTEADINAELARVRQMESRQKKAEEASKLPVVHQDVNNPEEGVLPIHAFEKFSGPRFGRHREYERRVYWGKRAQAPVKDYDFYVDEVDRKKEYQVIYYYRKGKVPKLVAQERFGDVKFLSNYDVDVSKSGKPKITTY